MLTIPLIIKNVSEMSGTKYLIDTNIVIYLTQKRLKVSDFAKKGGRLYISSISYIETLGYSFQNQAEEKEVTDFCDMFDRIFLTKEVERQTILIRKSYKIKLPDAIIAATAMVYSLILVTHNVDDFKNIRGLKILNPLWRFYVFGNRTKQKSCKPYNIMYAKIKNEKY